MNQDMELLSKLARLERMLHQEQCRLHREGRSFAYAGRGQGRILAMLKIKDEISTRELSYLLGIRVSSLNETLSKMEKNGCISRKPSPEDRRVSVICLTEKGRSEGAAQMEEPQIFSCFSKEEKEIFGDYLERLIVNLETLNGGEDIRANYDEKWMEMMRNHMGEEWYEHVAAIHGVMREHGQRRDAPKRRREERRERKNQEE